MKPQIGVLLIVVLLVFSLLGIKMGLAAQQPVPAPVPSPATQISAPQIQGKPVAEKFKLKIVEQQLRQERDARQYAELQQRLQSLQGDFAASQTEMQKVVEEAFVEQKMDKTKWDFDLTTYSFMPKQPEPAKKP